MGTSRPRSTSSPCPPGRSTRTSRSGRRLGATDATRPRRSPGREFRRRGPPHRGHALGDPARRADPAGARGVDRRRHRPVRGDRPRPSSAARCSACSSVRQPAAPPLTRAGEFVARPAADDDADTLRAGVQERLRRLERRLLEDAADAALLIVDGPLDGAVAVDHAVGYVKTHHVAYLEEDGRADGRRAGRRPAHAAVPRDLVVDPVLVVPAAAVRYRRTSLGWRRPLRGVRRPARRRGGPPGRWRHGDAAAVRVRAAQGPPGAAEPLPHRRARAAADPPARGRDPRAPQPCAPPSPDGGAPASRRTSSSSTGRGPIHARRCLEGPAPLPLRHPCVTDPGGHVLDRLYRTPRARHQPHDLLVDPRSIAVAFIAVTIAFTEPVADTFAAGQRRDARHLRVVLHPRRHRLPRFLAWVAFGRYGRVRLGGDDERPELLRTRRGSRCCSRRASARS